MNSHFTISKTAFVSFVSEFIHGYPDPDNPPPPGPWDPVIHQALVKMRARFGPQPQPWRAGSVAGRMDSLDWVLLNPQPLPPRLVYAAALSEQVIDSANSYFDMAEAMPSEVQGQLQEFAVNRLHTFMDDCGNGRIPKWPFPWPPRDEAPSDPLGPVEMMVIGVTFFSAGRSLANEQLRSVLQDIGSRLIDMAAGQMS
jgi:hypothetical protein